MDPSIHFSTTAITNKIWTSSNFNIFSSHFLMSVLHGSGVACVSGDFLINDSWLLGDLLINITRCIMSSVLPQLFPEGSGLVSEGWIWSDIRTWTHELSSVRLNFHFQVIDDLESSLLQYVTRYLKDIHRLITWDFCLY